MQRQGGYYNEVSGSPAFVQSAEASRRFATHLRSPRAGARSMQRRRCSAYSPGGPPDISERDRGTRASHAGPGIRPASPSPGPAAGNPPGGPQARERGICRKQADEHRKERTGARASDGGDTRTSARGFLNVLTENFRQILYGRDEDVVGIHIISYFIARTRLRFATGRRSGPAPRGRNRGAGYWSGSPRRYRSRGTGASCAP